MMKRTRSLNKDQHHMDQMAISDTNYNNHSHSQALGSNVKSNSIFNAPLQFVGLGPKGVVDSDSVWSPTSPLDDTFLSNLSKPFRIPRSSLHEGQQRSWDCCKVGLSIIDSLQDCSKFSGKILRSSENKKPSFSPQMMIKTPNCKTFMDSVIASRSLPKDFCKLPYSQNGSICHKGESTVLFEIGESLSEPEPFGKTRPCSFDCYRPIRDLFDLTGSNTDSESENFALNKVSSPLHFIGGSQKSNTLLPIELNSNPVSLCSSDEFVKSLSASDIELSEDYTCVISHGPNPKIKHIFCDCILETDSNDVNNHYKNEDKQETVSTMVVNRFQQTPNQYPSSSFLSFCYHCNKKLEEGKDIYIYRGEKAFCSSTCRALEIMNDEEFENSNPSSENSPKLGFGGDTF